MKRRSMISLAIRVPIATSLMPEALFAEPSPELCRSKMMSGILQMRLHPETRAKEYRIVWTGGKIEPVTPGDWAKLQLSHGQSQ